MSGTARWSPDALIAQLGGDEDLARQMALLFIAECPRMLKAVQEALASGRAEAIRLAAHALKGAAGNFASDGLTATAGLLEQAAADGRIEDAPGLVDRLERDAHNLLLAMSEFA
jgi:HPt (histidine-containing phosphotransfer) domain-containing protein